MSMVLGEILSRRVDRIDMRTGSSLLLDLAVPERLHGDSIRTSYFYVEDCHEASDVVQPVNTYVVV